MEQNIVITIARHFGSGGKTIGQMLAEDLGIKCYDKEVLRMASEESGINEALFNQKDEKLKRPPGKGCGKIHREDGQGSQRFLQLLYRQQVERRQKLRPLPIASAWGLSA